MRDEMLKRAVRTRMHRIVHKARSEKWGITQKATLIKRHN